MANEDPAEIPEQFRQNRPFFLVLALAILIAIGAFLFVLYLGTGSKDIERNAPPPAATQPAASEPAPAAPVAKAPAKTY